MWRYLILLLLAGCATTESGFADHQAIQDVLSRANRGFEISDPDLFANAFADDAVYELTGPGPVFGYERMKYVGREQIRTILTDRINKAKNTDPKTLSYDPASLRRFNRNSDENIVLVDAWVLRANHRVRRVPQQIDHRLFEKLRICLGGQIGRRDRGAIVDALLPQRRPKQPVDAREETLHAHGLPLRCG